MKIIKAILSLLVIFAMTVFSTGCAQNQIEQKVTIKFEKSLTALEINFISDAGKHAYEYDLWSYEKKDIYEEEIKATAPQKFTVEFNGEKYTGTFNEVYRAVPGPFVCTYKGEYYDFGINAKTKELVEFSYHNNAFDHGQITDEAKCREDADAFASKYIEVDQCRVDTEMLSSSKQCMFTYTREISGIETGEYMFLWIDGNGNITDFYTRLHNAFDNVLAIEIDEDKVFDAIEAKLAIIYDGVDDYESFAVENFYAVKLEDGRFALIYNIRAIFEMVYSEDGLSYHNPKTGIRLLITGATVKPAK